MQDGHGLQIISETAQSVTEVCQGTPAPHQLSYVYTSGSKVYFLSYQ